MIQAVIATEKTSSGNYYFVRWSADQMAPCWIDEKIYQEAITTPIPALDSQEKKTKNGELKLDEAMVIPVLNKEKASSRLAIMEFFAWRKHKSNKDLTQAEKKQKQGVKRYDSPVIQSLERICRDLEAKLQHPDQETYDDLIDYIEGYAYSKSYQMFLVANLLGKKKKACIPLKKMKKFFPETLKDYLQEIIELQKDNDRKRQLGAIQGSHNLQSERSERRRQATGYYFEDSSPNNESRQNKQRRSKQFLEEGGPSSEDMQSPSRIFPSMSIDQAYRDHHHNFLTNFFSQGASDKMKPEGVKRSDILFGSDYEDSSDEEEDESVE